MSPHCGALYFINERVKQPAPSDPSFSTCCQRRPFKFPPRSEVSMVLRELLTRSGTDARQFRGALPAFNAVLFMTSMTANYVKTGQDSSKLNPTMTVQGEVYNFIGASIPPQTIKYSYASAHAHDTEKVQRAAIRQSNVSQNLAQNILIYPQSAITQTNVYLQTFQSFCEWAQKDTPDIYKMVSHADKRPASEPARGCNTPEPSKVSMIIVRAEEEEVGTRNIELRTRGAINLSRDQILDKVPIRHYSHDPLSYVLLLPNDKTGWYQSMVMEYDTISISVVRGREEKMIRTGSRAQPVPRNHECQLP